MDFREDLEFHDDSGRVTDKAKESILLMKKKMFRSHDLILQYNNIMKECDRLKGDLCISQEKAIKLQKETASNNAKILKFESQISNYKKSREELEQKIAEQEIRIAGDRCHTEQLICKLKELETTHSGMLIEADVTKSSLEEKIKGLEQEMKKLKKVQAADLEKSLKGQRGKKRIAETVEIGVNTTEEKAPVKPTTAEKSMMTDEFYDIRDNPHPIFCENCQALTRPDIAKFVKMMTYHPPMLTEIVSPPPPPPPGPHNQESSNRDVSLGLLEPEETQESIAKSLRIVSPEIESLKEKLATLERKMKKRSKEISRKAQQPNATCCGHSHQANCCPPYGSNRATIMPPIYPDVQSDLFAEFWNRVVSSANEKAPGGTNNARSRSRRLGQKKSLALNKRRMKVSVKRKAKKYVGSSNWEVESDDSENQAGHLLRVNKSGDFIEESSITESITEHEETSKSGRSEKEKSTSEESFDNGSDETIEREPAMDSKTSPRRSSSRIREKSLRTPEIKRKTVNTSFIETLSISVDQSSFAAHAPDASCERKMRKLASPAESDLLAGRDRSISCSSGPAPPNNNCEISNNPNQIDINDRVDLRHSDSDLNVSMDSMVDTIRESRSELFHDDTELHEKTRKRKRSNSLTRSKRSVKSKLLCKLRALKKNTTPVSIPLVNIDHSSNGNYFSPIAKIHDDSNANDCSQDSSMNEPFIEIASKKNRIAHVPKSCMSKERDAACSEANEISENKSGINFPREETRGVHFSLNHLKGLSQTMDKPKNLVIKMKSPTARKVSNLKKSIEIENDRCSISVESDTPTDKTNATDNILESLVSCENEENGESCKKVVMKIGGATKSLDRPEPSLGEKQDSAIPDALMKIAGSECVDDESPASPSDTHKSNSPNASLDSTESPKNRVSIYETAVLPDAVGNLRKSDTILLEDFRVNVEKMNFPISPDSQMLLDNSDMTDEKEKPFAKNAGKSQAIVKDLRTRSILCSPLRSLGVGQQNLPKSTNPTIQDNSCDKTGAVGNHRGIRTLETLLTRHLGSQKKKCRSKVRLLRKNAAIKLQTDAEQSIKSELENLLENAEWSSSLHTTVLTKFRQVASQRTVAKCIVDVLVERAELDETLDRTYTPPAPVMTGTQRRIAALINDLERDPSMSGVFELVRTGIDFNLFRLGQAIQPLVVEYLARMLIVMARLKKDRESVRIMCCDALYFLGRLAPNVIYIALTIWPEILPMHNARPDVMTNALIHLMIQQQGPKLASIRRMLRDYYKFPENEQDSKEVIKPLINRLDKEYTRELEVTILLIAKREGTEWAYKHIVDGGLMQIIENDNCPWISNILTLLGFILRTFPTEDEDKRVGAMVEKLCDMLESSQDSPDKEEGIIAALLGLSRHTIYFKRIADTILKWKPSETMRTGTIEQLEGFFKMRSPEWWNKWKNKKLK